MLVLSGESARRLSWLLAMSVTSTYPTTRLLGRRRECAVLDELLGNARTGTSGVLVVRGEAGIGKTALLDYAAGRATGFRVARVGGVESEMELPFAGLHLLFGPLLDRLERLPDSQRDALTVALGVREGRAPDRLLVGLAVLSMVADLAEEQPVACLIDDAQWLDQSSLQAFAFAARRLVAERVAMVFAARASSHVPELTGLPELTVPRLSDPDAHALIASAVHGRFDPSVEDRLVRETDGNPLAILKLPLSLNPAELAGGFGVATTEPLPELIKSCFCRESQALPGATRQLLLTAAAEPTGDLALLWRAAALQAIGTDAAAPAEAAELVDFSVRAQFRHPLVRSAIYQAALPEERRTVHRALAEATDPQVDPDRRAWHRARAAAGPDEPVAAELARSAGRAQARGGLAAAAAFLEQAAELTPRPALRGARALAAAQAKFDAGSPDAAFRLLAIAATAPLDALQRARLERLRARLTFFRTRGSNAPALLLDAAKGLAQLDAGLARETYLEAIEAAVFAGRLGDGIGLPEVTAAARNAPQAPQPPQSIDLLLDGLVTRFAEGYSDSLSPLRRALRAFARAPAPPRHEEMFWYYIWVECLLMPEPIAPDLLDDQAWQELATRAVGQARHAGAAAALPIALGSDACVSIQTGDFSTAAAQIDEAQAVSEVTGNAALSYASLVLAGWRGQESTALDFIEASVKDATARGEGRAIGVAEYAKAVLYNGLGHYEAALAAGQRACQYEDLGFFALSLTELVEAAARAGDPEAGAHALAVLTERTGASGTDWALGVQARSRALLSDGQAAGDLYRQAVQRLGRTRMSVHLARALLVHGEWLRRENRRHEARDELRRAYEIFSRAGADAFAERARRELMATGETVRKRMVDNSADLTAQEAQVAALAGKGLSNAEIATQMFISPRTVEWHLGNVFSKLGITSRKDLR
jgi:DNA-binding CsgD family transcriptional regulator